MSFSQLHVCANFNKVILASINVSNLKKKKDKKTNLSVYCEIISGSTQLHRPLFHLLLCLITYGAFIAQLIDSIIVLVCHIFCSCCQTTEEALNSDLISDSTC